MLFTTILRISAAFTILDKNAMPFYYPISSVEGLVKNPISKIEVFGHPLVCYDNKNGSYIVHTDICPHQGASLSKGWVSEMGNLQCPYHGFEFCSGMFCKIPNPMTAPPAFKSRTKLPVYPTLEKNGLLFLSPVTLKNPPIPEPFFPPEEYDRNFRSVEGSRIVGQNYMTVCENLLDMLHISYVHSFGNSFSPLPYAIKSRRLTKNSGRTEFLYQPRDMTISGKVGRVSKVVVQNEYHLPTNTVTRVVAGPVIKTIFTRSLPISENETLLFWKVYRNFWTDPYVPEFSTLGDWVMSFLMDMTLDEDVKMLSNVYKEHRIGPLKTKYDVTIQNFRSDVERVLNEPFPLPPNATQSYLQAYHDYDI
jgi:phenylpropionate dioxygenase-like ring-hydroxylating dioxygenase large terminal subunit